MAGFTASTKKTNQNPGEMYFSWYLDELIKYGYLKRYDREPETYIVLDAYKHKRERHLKSKPNVVEDFVLLPDIKYTYDFRLIWTEKAINIFTNIFDPKTPFKFGKPLFISHYMDIAGQKEIVSYTDVKPHSAAAKFGGGKLSSFYTFPFVQKFLMNKYGLYINKVIPKNEGKHGVNTCLFAISFVPNRFLYTDSGSTLRKVKFRKVSLKQFVDKRSKGIEDLLAIEAKKNAKNNQGNLF